MRLIDGVMLVIRDRTESFWIMREAAVKTMLACSRSAAAAITWPPASFSGPKQCSNPKAAARELLPEPRGTMMNAVRTCRRPSSSTGP